ncbi:MAG TPA: hypothetical protein VF474_06400 [Phenylobacterium sp.]
MLAWVAWENRVEDTQPDRAFSTLDSGSEAERAVAGRLLQEGYTVLRSSAFRTQLEALQDRYPVIYARASQQDLDPAGVAAIVSLEPPGSRFAPAQAMIVDDGGPMLGAAGEGGTTGRYSDVMITRGVLEAFGSSDVVTRSCAVNVAAHEYAHTISLTPVGYRVAFTDTNEAQREIADRRHPGTPVASYLIGSVAQCVWLERQGRIGPDDIGDCIAVFGTAAFNWDRCGQFAGGEPVAPRPGLAPAVPPL